jgi:glutamate racemase
MVFLFLTGMQATFSGHERQNNSLPVGIFDSGIGGLTVLHRALQEMPGEDYLYYADTSHVPYGNKTKEEVHTYILQGVSFLKKRGIKALVLACNTATSIAVNDLRKIYDFPVIGMEPAIKPAVEKTRNKRVLVLATQLTLQEQKFKDLVSKVDNEGIIDFLALPELVEFAEHFIFNTNEVLNMLQDKFSHFNPDVYGTVVLGCTHFPYYKNTLKKIFPPFIDIIDGNTGTVNHLKNLLQSKNLLSSTGTGKITFFNSGTEALHAARFLRYLEWLDDQDKVQH